MIILVSDLHLADTAERRTINLPSLLGRLKADVERAHANGIANVKIVLLGDIFEILKSDKWLGHRVRPWDEAISSRHIDAVSAIFDSIVACNEDFFTGLSDLSRVYSSSLKLIYVPGNHDRPLNTPMGAAARKILQARVPVGVSGGKRFNDIFRDNDHRLSARHGHEYDSSNRYTKKGAAIGDVVVVNILLRLPQLMAGFLRFDEYDERLEFLHELDNVRPPGERFMAQWLLGGLAALEREGADAAAALEHSFATLLRELEGALVNTRFEAPGQLRWWIDFFTLARPLLRRYGAARALELALKRTPGTEGAGAQGEAAFVRTALAARRASMPLRYIVCGHTHNPLIAPLDHESTRRSVAPLYLNTGTWRRVQRAADLYDMESRLTSFSPCEEECVVTVYSPADQGVNSRLPTYEFHRVTRGANS